MQCISKKKIEAFAQSKKIIYNPTTTTTTTTHFNKHVQDFFDTAYAKLLVLSRTHKHTRTTQGQDRRDPAADFGERQSNVLGGSVCQTPVLRRSVSDVGVLGCGAGDFGRIFARTVHGIFSQSPSPTFPTLLTRWRRRQTE